METLDCGQVMAWRLRRHHLHERAPAGAMLDVTADPCGLDRRPARARLGGGAVATPGPPGRWPPATRWTG
jgi:hypothetical protein